MRKKARIRKTMIERKKLRFILVFVIIAISTMSIAYAALSTTLRISGTAKFQDASWGIKVEEQYEEPEWISESDFIFSDNVAILGNAQLITKPTISGTSINDFKIQLTKPGDQIDLIYKITNTGNIPAVFSDYIGSYPTYSSSTNNQEDIQLARQNFHYSVQMYQYGVLEGENSYEQTYFIYPGSVLCPGATAEFVFYGSLNTNIPKMPSSLITVSDIDIEFIFTPGARNLCNGSIPVINEE